MAINITHLDELAIKNVPSLKSALNKRFQDVEINLIQKMGLDKKNAFQKQLSDLNPYLLIMFAHHCSFWQSLFHKSFTKQAISYSKSPALVV
ncbi:MAG: hypothetical protein HQ463_03680 [Bacteroidetes bacterium]|nr:hypothetical protein [Bacteroidota bacterium]